MKIFRIVFFILGLVLFVVLVRRVAGADVAAVFASIDWRLSALAFLCYCGVNLMRMESISLILGGKVPRRRVLSLVFLQNFFNVLFSFSGDAAYVFLLKRRGTVTLGENLASLLAAKILDFFTLTSVFFGFVMISGIPALSSLRAPSALIFAASVSLAALSFARPSVLPALVAGAGSVVGIGARPAFLRVLKQAQEIAGGFSFFRSRRVAGRVALTTLCNWFLTFLSGFLLLRGVGVTIGFGATLFAYTFPIAAGLTPAFVLGGFGSYEGAFAFGLTRVGIAAGQAIASSVALHVQELGFLLVLAAAGFIIHYYDDTD